MKNRRNHQNPLWMPITQAHGLDFRFRSLLETKLFAVLRILSASVGNHETVDLNGFSNKQRTMKDRLGSNWVAAKDRNNMIDTAAPQSQSTRSKAAISHALPTDSIDLGSLTLYHHSSANTAPNATPQATKPTARTAQRPTRTGKALIEIFLREYGRFSQPRIDRRLYGHQGEPQP